VPAGALGAAGARGQEQPSVAGRCSGQRRDGGVPGRGGLHLAELVSQQARHHRPVPTWNYQVVHVHGRLAIRDDERYVRGLVARLTRRDEGGQPVPWRMGDAPVAFTTLFAADTRFVSPRQTSAPTSLPL
jgi:hypothetical protein